MADLREPNLPAVGKDPEQQRAFAGVRDIIRGIIREGVFLTRYEIAKILRPVAIQPILALNWGALNRVELTAATTAQLPAILSEWIGVPLFIWKLSGTGTLTLTPSGFATGATARPTINGAANTTKTSAGLYIAITDGQNWAVT